MLVVVMVVVVVAVATTNYLYSVRRKYYCVIHLPWSSFEVVGLFPFSGIQGIQGNPGRRGPSILLARGEGGGPWRVLTLGRHTT